MEILPPFRALVCFPNKQSYAPTYVTDGALYLAIHFNKGSKMVLLISMSFVFYSWIISTNNILLLMVIPLHLFHRSFFEACGFGEDSLGATTMMYTRTVSSCEANHMVKHVGRKLLVAPLVREPFKPWFVISHKTVSSSIWLLQPNPWNANWDVSEELKFASVSDIDIPFSYLVSTEKHNFRKQGKRGWKSGGIKEDMPALAHDLAEVFM